MLDFVEPGVAIKRTDGSRVAYVEHRGPPGEIGLAFRALLERLRNRGIRIAGPMIAIHYRDPDARMDRKPWSEAAVPIFGAFRGGRGIGVRDLRPCEVASLIYDGPASRYPSAFQTLRDWIRANGYARSGPIFEIYARDLSELPPGIVYVEIQVPIRKRRAAVPAQVRPSARRQSPTHVDGSGLSVAKSVGVRPGAAARRHVP